MGHGMTTDTNTTVYVPRRFTFRPIAYWREVLQHSRFAYAMAKANLKARHYDSVFGQIWHLLNPLLLAAVYYLLFAIILPRSGDQLEFIRSLLAGLFAFTFIRLCMSMGGASIVGTGTNYVMNAKFPRAVLPFSATVASLLLFLPQILIYVVLSLPFGGSFGAPWVLVPVLVVVMFVFGLGLALIFAVSTVYVRDVATIQPFLARIWLYVSPVLWDIDSLPDTIKSFAILNPLVPILGAWRDVVVNSRWPSPYIFWGAVAWAVGTLVIGTLMFQPREHDFAIRL